MKVKEWTVQNYVQELEDQKMQGVEREGQEENEKMIGTGDEMTSPIGM